MRPTLVNVAILLTVAISCQLVTGQRRICPIVVPANVSVNTIVGRFYGIDYFFLQPAFDTDCSSANFMPMPCNKCPGVAIPRHQYYTYHTNQSFDLYETILREPSIGLYTQQRVRDMSFPLTTVTIMYYKNGHLLVNGCREGDSFTRYVLFSKCRSLTQAQKDEVYRDASDQIPSRYALYPGTRNNCDADTF